MRRCISSLSQHFMERQQLFSTHGQQEVQSLLSVMHCNFRCYKHLTIHMRQT